MTYAVKQDMIDRFSERELIQLTDKGEPAAGVIDDDVLNDAIADAGAEIDGYVSARYTLPLSPVPSVLTRMACDIARYYLYRDSASDLVIERYRSAVRFLKEVSAGHVSLGVDAAGEAPAAAADGVEFETGAKVFAREDDDA